MFCSDRIWLHWLPTCLPKHCWRLVYIVWIFLYRQSYVSVFSASCTNKSRHDILSGWHISVCCYRECVYIFKTCDILLCFALVVHAGQTGQCRILCHWPLWLKKTKYFVMWWRDILKIRCDGVCWWFYYEFCCCAFKVFAFRQFTGNSMFTSF